MYVLLNQSKGRQEQFYNIIFQIKSSQLQREYLYIINLILFEYGLKIANTFCNKERILGNECVASLKNVLVLTNAWTNTNAYQSDSSCQNNTLLKIMRYDSQYELQKCVDLSYFEMKPSEMMTKLLKVRIAALCFGIYNQRSRSSANDIVFCQ